LSNQCCKQCWRNHWAWIAVAWLPQRTFYYRPKSRQICRWEKRWYNQYWVLDWAQMTLSLKKWTREAMANTYVEKLFYGKTW